MKLLVTVTILLVVLPAFARAQETHRRDGNWWRGLEAGEKLDYMVGFFDGMELGGYFSYWGMTKDSNGKVSSCSTEAARSFEDMDTKYFRGVTNSQIADGLDAFYKDYRNRSIKVHDAVWLVVNSIAGKPQRDLDEMIESWRKNASNN